MNIYPPPLHTGTILTTWKTVNAILRLVEIHAAGLCLQNIPREK